MIEKAENWAELMQKMIDRHNLLSSLGQLSNNSEQLQAKLNEPQILEMIKGFIENDLILIEREIKQVVHKNGQSPSTFISDNTWVEAIVSNKNVLNLSRDIIEKAERLSQLFAQRNFETKDCRFMYE